MNLHAITDKGVVIMGQVSKLAENQVISFDYPVGFEQVINSFDDMSPDEAKELIEGFMLFLAVMI